jgi:long-chain fatty acid transport protein
MIGRATRGSVPALLSLATALLSPATAAAAGFYLSQQSIQGAGRGFAGGAALGRDASTAYTNPAALTRLETAEAVAGVSVISPHAGFSNRSSTAASPGTAGAAVGYGGGGLSNSYDPTPIPNFHVAVPVPGDRVWLGLAITSPFGIGVKFPKGWFGRYDAIRGDLRTIDVAPTVAVKISEHLSIGGGVDVQYADASQTAAIPDPFAPGGPTVATDGRSRLEGEDWSTGFNVGVLFTFSPDTRVGVHYRSGITHELEGENTVTGLTGPLAANNGRFSGTTDLDLPDIVAVAAAHDLAPDLTVSGEFQWFRWSRFEEIRAEFDNGGSDLAIPQNYRNSIALSVGADYAWNERLTTRAGFRYETSPVRDRFRTASVPDNDNYSLGLGVTYAAFDGLSVDLSVFGTIWEKTELDLQREFFVGTPAETRVDIEGRAESYSATFALGVRWIF